MPYPSLLSAGRAAVIALACCLAAGASHALTVTGFRPTFSCTNMTWGPFTYQADRDNTGGPPPGAEAYTLEARDGAGVQLYRVVNPGLLLSFPGPIPDAGATTPYSMPPTANPITFTIVSHAGNGLAEQLIFSASGSCATLPPAAMAAVPTLGAGHLGALAAAMALLGARLVRRRRRD